MEAVCAIDIRKALAVLGSLNTDIAAIAAYKLSFEAVLISLLHLRIEIVVLCNAPPCLFFAS